MKYWYFEETPKQRRKRLKDFAKNLQKNLAKSEVWFFGNYLKLKHKNDLFNCPFQNQYIPDILNHKYKYIIEIDGSIHDTPKQKQKDIKKDLFYKKFKYRVFRVKAFQKESFFKCIEWLYKIRDIPYIRVSLQKRKFNKY